MEEASEADSEEGSAVDWAEVSSEKDLAGECLDNLAQRVDSSSELEWEALVDSRPPSRTSQTRKR